MKQLLKIKLKNLDLNESPHTSTTSLALNRHVSHHTITGILKKEKLYPYKLQLLQVLSEDDYDRRVEFYEELMKICTTLWILQTILVYSDEASSFKRYTVNRHNC